MDQDATWHEGRPQPRRVCYMGTHPPPHKGGGAPSPIFGPVLVAKRLRTLYYMGTQSPFLQRKQSLGRGTQIFGPCLLGPNGWMDQDGTWHGGWPWSSPHCAGWGHSSPPQKGGTEPPNFWPIFIVAKRLGASRYATWYGGRLQRRRLCVRWGPSPYPKRGGAPTEFSAHVYCGQTAACIKMLLGTEVGLDLRDTMFAVDPATPRKRAQSTTTLSLAHVYCGQMADWMKTPLGMEVHRASKKRPTCGLL